MKETDIQSQILQYLKAKNIFHWRQNNLAVRGRKFVGLKGVADILVLHEGLFFAIECKKPGEKQSQEQINFEYYILLNGGRYILAYSLDDIINIF